MNDAAAEPQAAILAQLAALLAELLKRPTVSLTMDTTAADVDGWDSLIMLTFMFGVERHFGVTFKSGEMDRFKTVGDLVARLQQRTDADSL